MHTCACVRFSNQSSRGGTEYRGLPVLNVPGGENVRMEDLLVAQIWIREYAKFPQCHGDNQIGNHQPCRQAAQRLNTNGCFVVDLGNNTDPANAFSMILSVLEQANTEQ